MKLDYSKVLICLLVVMASTPTELWGQSVPFSVIPYHGYVERDGVVVDGLLGLVFELSDGSGDPWSESYVGAESVVVVDGRFVVLLGRTTPIPPAFFEEETLELQIYEEVDARLEPLGPAQPIVPVPYALWATGGSDFDVQGSLTVTEMISATSVELGGEIRAEQDRRGSGGVFSATGASAVVEGTSITGATLGSSTDITTGVGSTFTVGNELTVGSAISFDGGSGNGDGGSAVSYEASDTLSFGSGLAAPVRIDGAVAYTGASVVATGSVDIRGTLTADAWTVADRAFFTRRMHNEGQGNGVFVFTESGGLGNNNLDRWFCWPGGIEMLTGDICELSTTDCGGGAIFSNFTAFSSGSTSWFGYFGFLTHGSGDEDIENIRVGYVCAQRGVVGVVCDANLVCSANSDNAGAACTDDSTCINGYCEPNWNHTVCASGTGSWFGDP